MPGDVAVGVDAVEKAVCTVVFGSEAAFAPVGGALGQHKNATTVGHHTQLLAAEPIIGQSQWIFESCESSRLPVREEPARLGEGFSSRFGRYVGGRFAFAKNREVIVSLSAERILRYIDSRSLKLTLAGSNTTNSNALSAKVSLWCY